MSRNLLNRILTTALTRAAPTPPRSRVYTSLCNQQACHHMCSSRLNNTSRTYCSTAASLVIDKKEEKEFVELYKDLKTYNAEQILDLMTVKRKHNLDPTHLAICMKRMYASYVEAEDKNGFVEKIKLDPRFMKLINHLMVSARHLTSPIICEMVKFSQALDCPLPIQYGLLKLCTSAISDVTIDKFAELSGVLMDSLDILEKRLRHGALSQNDVDWVILLFNQMELLFKCLSLLYESKAHQVPILDATLRIDLLLGFGTKLPSSKKLLLEIHRNFDEFENTPEELARLIPALMSSYLSYSMLPQTSPAFSWVSMRISQFKDLLTSFDPSTANKLLKGISVEDKYDEMCQRFDLSIQREKESIESQVENSKECLFMINKLIDMAFSACYNLEQSLCLEKKSALLVLGACAVYIKAKTNALYISRCMELARMVSDIILDELASQDQRESWSVQELVEVLSTLGEIGYFSKGLSDAMFARVQEGGVCDRKILKQKLNPTLALMTKDQFLALMDTFAAFDLQSSSALPSTSHVMDVLLDHVEDCIHKTFFSQETKLDVRMKLASYMKINGRNIDVELIESLLINLKSNIEMLQSNETLKDVSKVFLNCFRDAAISETSRELWSEINEALKKASSFKLTNQAFEILWPGKVSKCPSNCYGYVVDLSSGDLVKPRRVKVDFYSNDCFWTNTCQLKPLFYHLEKSTQLEGYHVVPLNLRTFAKRSDAMEYLKYRVRRSNDFQDLLHIV